MDFQPQQSSYQDHPQYDFLLQDLELVTPTSAAIKKKTYSPPITSKLDNNNAMIMDATDLLFLEPTPLDPCNDSIDTLFDDEEQEQQVSPSTNINKNDPSLMSSAAAALTVSSILEPTPMSMDIEPTPMRKAGSSTSTKVAIVNELPLTAAPWFNDKSYLDCLRPLLGSSSLSSKDKRSYFPSTDGIKRLQDYAIDVDLSGSSPLGMSTAATNNNSSSSASFSSFAENDGATAIDHRNISCSSPTLSNSSFATSSFSPGSPNSSVNGGSSNGSGGNRIEQWNQRYTELVEFKTIRGHCNVPLEYATNPSLSHWVKRQRYQYGLKCEGKHSTLTQERQDLLHNLGFVWDSHAASWDLRYQELVDFQRRFHHCNVPTKYPENPQLAIWVKCQRRQYKLFEKGSKSNITQPRINKLLCLGFVFHPRTQNKQLLKQF